MLESEKVGIISSLKDLKLKLEELNEKVSQEFIKLNVRNRNRIVIKRRIRKL